MAYADYQSLESSEKVVLIKMQASKRLMGWASHAGNVYKIDFAQPIVSLLEDGTALSSVAAVPTGQSEYYHDTDAGVLYIWTSDDAHPNGKFIAVTFWNHYASSGGVHLAYDLSTGYEVHYLPLVKSTSKFGVALDNKEFLGFALEGQGSISFLNDRDYWDSIYDKWFWDNQIIQVYSWNRDLTAAQAKLIFSGLTISRSYKDKSITFKVKDQFKELRQPISLDNLEDASGAVVPSSREKSKQRLLYGRVQGLIPYNIDSALPAGNLITGTVTVTSGSATVTGSGTAFLDDVRQNDTVIFSNINDTEYTVLSITSDTSLTLTENFSGTTTAGSPCKVKHAVPHRFQNRTHLIAGHALKEPATTVASASRVNVIELTDGTDFFNGAEIKVGSDYTVIQSINGNVARVSPYLSSVPAASTAVTLMSVWNVYLNDRKLDISNGDYTYSAADSTITLDDAAEFNVAPIKYMAGTMTFSIGSSNVTGSGTAFTSDLNPGDWVLNNGDGTWYEVRTITSDTALVLRSTGGAAGNGTGNRMKNPDVFDANKVILSVNAMGATTNGVKTGTFIGTAAAAVKDILTRAGLSSLLNTASFTTADSVAPQIIGLAIPQNTYSIKPEKSRDMINLINQSVFGSLYQNDDFELEYSIIEPSRTTSYNLYTEPDIMGLQIISDSSRLVKDVTIEYLFKEYDPDSGEQYHAEYTHTSETGEYLGKTNNELRLQTVLTAAADAKVFAQRWAFIKEVVSSVVRFKTGLQASDLHIHDKIKLSHEKIYDRYGSTSEKVKLCGISSIKRDLAANDVEIDDIGNAYNRTAAITANDASIFDDATNDELLLNGYITDNYGLINNDEDTYQTNGIW